MTEKQWSQRTVTELQARIFQIQARRGESRREIARLRRALAIAKTREEQK